MECLLEIHFRKWTFLSYQSFLYCWSICKVSFLHIEIIADFAFMNLNSWHFTGIPNLTAFSLSVCPPWARSKFQRKVGWQSPPWQCEQSVGTRLGKWSHVEAASNEETFRRDSNGAGMGKGGAGRGTRTLTNCSSNQSSREVIFLTKWQAKFVFEQMMWVISRTWNKGSEELLYPDHP